MTVTPDQGRMIATTAQRVPVEVFDLGAAIRASRAQQETIERERDELTAAYIAQMQAMKAGNRLEDLADAMKGFRSVFGTGWTKRAGAAGLPKLSALNGVILARCNDGTNRWRGPWPLGEDDPRPQRGTWVVYQLMDTDDELLYIGSTGSFLERLKAHQSTKEFASWRAARCANEKHCRDLETALIDRYRPPLNRMIPTPRMALT